MIAISKVVSELLIINMGLTGVVVGTLLFSAIFVSRFLSEPLLLAINVAIILITPFGMNWLYSGLVLLSELPDNIGFTDLACTIND